jgi:hypothetical protein
MRLTAVTLHANDEEFASFALSDPRASNQYIAKAIIGLDAPEIVSKFYGFGTVSRNRFFDISLKEREIVMRIALNPRWTINESYSDLRDEIYRAIASNRTGRIELQFHSGSALVATLIGYITKVEVPHFSRTPELQITVVCDNPLFRGVNPVRLETEHIGTTNPVVIQDGISTAPHGFKFQITFNAVTTSFSIQESATPDWKFEIIPGTIASATGFQINDQLHFSSNHDDKYLYLRRGSTNYNLVDKIQPGAIWPVIFPGQNPFHVVSGAFTWNFLEFYAAYWGV